MAGKPCGFDELREAMLRGDIAFTIELSNSNLD